jgi:hypothetical protein
LDRGNQLVDVAVESGAGVPMSVVEAAISRKATLDVAASKPDADSFEAAFSVWAMFDHDVHPGVLDAKTRALAKGVHVAFSNPCIELWALLHFQDQDGPLERGRAQSLLAGLMTGYHHGRNPVFVYSTMRQCFEIAETRAKRLLQRRIEEGDPEGNPSTSVHLLLAEIVRHGRKSRS